MSDLIRRGDLLKPDEKSDKILILGGRVGAGKTLAMAEALMKRKIEAVPAVDAVPVVHGRWIPADGEGETCDEWDCSICERRLTFGEEMETDEVYELNHYCPNCGAKMDGGEDNAEK